ncbi:amidohydrolase family protein [Pelagicoccus enzymogenes]|uniref:amidohydrolase family protein n=1 Tax=Pelagicoccus enzymogenes TaxID=2773457 RepID=UPI00280FAADA|nr:amidohydrolase family protein [Pelagicoccus enzymogenes]MDQ8198021.1 amidohydrolase family protein [Pelagicoccus enzymogenes]
MTFIDSNLSIGRWPFASLPQRSPQQLTTHLQKHQIQTGLVSHLETLFLADPDPANRELLSACKRIPELVPVPALNLALPNWLASLESYRTAAEIKAVKLYPNFHNFRLTSRACTELVQHLQTEKIRLIVNVRVQDERHQYHGLKIRGVPTQQLRRLAQRFPDFKILCTGLYRPEILELAPDCPNLNFDLSFADWHELLSGLLETISPDRLFFGSHTPLMVTGANTYKLQSSTISQSLKTQIARGNAQRFFEL